MWGWRRGLFALRKAEDMLSGLPLESSAETVAAWARGEGDGKGNMLGHSAGTCYLLIDTSAIPS